MWQNETAIELIVNLTSFKYKKKYLRMGHTIYTLTFSSKQKKPFKSD